MQTSICRIVAGAPQPAVLALALVGPIGLMACGGGSPPSGPGTAVVASVEVTPTDPVLSFLGETRELEAVVRDAEDRVLSGRELDWASSDADVVSVSSDGRIEGHANGSVTIRASTGGVVGEAAVHVAQVATSVSVTGAPDYLLGAGASATLAAEARDAGGSAVAGETITWESSDPGVVTVDGDGTVTAVSHGDAVIEATASGGVAGGAPVSVLGLTGAGVESLDRDLADFLRRWNVPGLTLAVAVDGRLVVARGLGLADAVTGAPIEPGALVRIASVSKPITSAAIVRLVEIGVLDLDDRLFPDLLPGPWADAQPPVDARLGDITVRHALNHRGGWNRAVSGDPMFRSRQIAGALGIAGPPEADDIIDYMLTRPLDVTPGTAVYYSNFAYTALAHAIETAGGKDYETWVLQEILGPAGAPGMRIGGTLAADRLAGEVAYHALGSEAAPVPSVFGAAGTTAPWPYGGFYLPPMDGHGGWVGSAIDLVKFGLALDGRHGDDVIAPASRALLAGDLVPLAGGQYGYGWFVDGDGTWHHTGRLPGSASRLVVHASGVVYAVLLNASHPDEAAFLGDLVGTLNTGVASVTSWPDVDLFPN